MPVCYIAEEAPIIRKVAARILDEFGFNSNGVTTFEDLRQRVSQQQPNLVIVSETLEDIDCVEIISTVRRMPGGQNAVVLVCSTQNGLGLRSRVRRAGGDGLLIKPFTRETFVHQLRAFGLLSSAAA